MDSDTYRIVEPHIAKVNYPKQAVIGYMVRWCKKGRYHSKLFSSSKYASWEDTLIAAQALKAKLFKKGVIKQTTRRDWATKPRRKSSTGTVGVQHVIVKRGEFYYECFQAVWTPIPGQHRKKTFSVMKYGFREARRMALQARKEGLESMQNADAAFRTFDA